MNVTKEEIIDILTNNVPEELEKAKYQFDSYHIIDESYFPFTGAIYNKSKSALCSALSTLGFGDTDVIGMYVEDHGNVYAIYSNDEFDATDAIEWLEDHAESLA